MIGIGNEFELNVDPEREGRTEVWSDEERAVIEGAARVRDGGGHHLAGTVSPAGMVHYVDAANVGDNSAPIVFDAVTAVVMGQRIPRGLFWKGTIDDVRLYGRPLTEYEVRQNFDAGPTSVKANERKIVSLSNQVTVLQEGIEQNGSALKKWRNRTDALNQRVDVLAQEVYSIKGTQDPRRTWRFPSTCTSRT